MTAEIIALDEQRERRRYIALVHATDDWRQIKASFAIENMILDDANAEIIGRMLACEMTLQDVQKVILRGISSAPSKTDYEPEPSQT